MVPELRKKRGIWLKQSWGGPSARNMAVEAHLPKEKGTLEGPRVPGMTARWAMAHRPGGLGRGKEYGI